LKGVQLEIHGSRHHGVASPRTILPMYLKSGLSVKLTLSSCVVFSHLMVLGVKPDLHVLKEHDSGVALAGTYSDWQVVCVDILYAETISNVLCI
jgi:hypothetical protein